VEASTTVPGRPGGAGRALAVLVALVLAFVCAVMIAAMVDIGGTPTCHDVSTGAAARPGDGQCFSGSSFQRTITLALGYPSGVLAGVAAALAVAFAITGRRGELVWRMALAAIVLGVIGIGIGSM
jgi:hypothetical protein